MKRITFIIAAIALGVAGVALSFLVIPSDSEVALIQFKDKKYEEAKRLYEEQYKQGNLTIDVVMHLTGVYLQFGEIDKAIKVMEDFVKQHPDHLAARRELGSLYQYGQRLDDYARNLEEINRIEQSGANLKILSDVYQYNEQYDKQLPVVVQLVEKDEKKDPNTLDNAARMLASEKKYDQAVDMLRKLRTQTPAAFTYAQFELMVRLLIDGGHKQEALAEVMKFRETQPSLDQVANLANIVNFLIGAPEAYDFVLPYENKMNEHPGLMSEYVLILMRLNKHEKAYALLKPKYDDGSLPPALQDEMLFLAVNQKDEKTTDELIHKIDFSAMTEDATMSLVELGLANHLPQLTGIIDKKFRENPQAAASKPRLDAALAMVRKDAEVKAKLDALKFDTMEFSQRSQLARICALTDNASCVDRYLASLPDVTTLSEADTVGVGEITLAARHYEKGRDYLKPVKDNYHTTEFQAVWVRLAAANGDMDTVTKWLEANPNSINKALFAELYFFAMNTKHYELAVDLAERMISLENNSDTRGYLVQAYIKSGQMREAVAVLREHKNESKEDADNYLYALIQLVKKDKAYSSELSQYAQERLAAGKLPYKQRLALIYALIDSGQGHVAMPYVRNIALQEGGDWVSVYTDFLIKNNDIEGVTAFWQQLAETSHADKKQLSQIAFNLLEHGNREPALMMFDRLAQDEPADSPIVQQLVYLWGPNLNQQQLDWIGVRAAREQDPKLREQWLRYLVNGSNAKSLMQYVHTDPTSLDYTVVEEPYLAALMLTDKNDYMQTYLAHRIDNTQDAASLKRYAGLAVGYNVNLEAVHAYEKLLTVQPNDGEALLFLGVDAHNRADYSLSRTRLSEYIALLETNQIQQTTDSQEAYYYMAEILRRDHDKDAKRYYDQVVKMTQAQDKPDRQARSQLAQAFAFSGDLPAARGQYEELMLTYPDDNLIRADYANLLIDMKDYKQADAVMAGYSGPSYDTGRDLKPLVLHNSAIRGYELIGYDQQLIVSFDPKSKSRGWLTEAQLKDYPWASYTGEGYDRAILTTQPNYRMEVTTSADGSLVVTPVPIISEQEIRATEQLGRRYVLLGARAKLETGKDYQARESLHALLAQYPDNPEVLGFTANAENYMHNWPRALDLLDQAQALQPENEDIARLKRDIRRRNDAQSAYIDEEWRMLGDNDEFITTVGGNYLMDYKWEIGAVLQHDKLDTVLIQRTNGAVNTFDGDRQRGELYLRRYWENGERLQGSLFANNDTFGAGAAFNWINPLGYTGVEADYHRPYWDFVETVVSDTTRDRIELNHTVTFKDDITVSAQLGANNYNTDRDDDLTQTAFFGGQVTVPLVRDDYYLAVGYGIDGEYIINRDQLTNAAGGRFNPLPVRSREIHFLSLTGSKDLTENTTGEATVGYAFDRLGEHGPAAELRLRHYLTEQVSVEGRASYGLSSADTNEEAKRLGVQLKYQH